MVKRFAEFAVAQRGAPLADDVYHAATRALVDWYSATLAGSDMAPALILRRALGVSETAGGSGLIPDGLKVDSRAAALINGTASHTAELDDIFREGIYHPGSPTVAAALAAAERVGATGQQLLRAIAVGYEIGDRIAAAVQPSHYTYWHTTGTVGTIGAAAAVAELLELDVEPFAHALATATTNAAGLQQAFRSDSMSKPLHAGHAAEAGLIAAFAAEQGFTGALDILEGSVGFGTAMSHEPDWKSAVDRLGKPWAVTQATVKNHSCCGHTFAAVDSALEMRAEGLVSSSIDAIEIGTYTTATKVAGYDDPQSEFEAKFSLVYCVAAAFQLGSVRLAAFAPNMLIDPDLRALIARSKVSADPEFDADFPGRRRARVTVRLADGSSVSRVRNTRKGDPDDPLTDAELKSKFDDLAVPVIGAERSGELSDALWNLRGSEDIQVSLANATAGGAGTRTEEERP